MATEWDDAVAAVHAGEDVVIRAAALVAQMTDDERRWCLDGDIPFWAGMADLGTGGYHRRPFLAARVERLGVPGFRFSDGPRGVVVGNATAFPVTMARGATWDVDLEERIGDAIGLELRAVGADLYGGVCVNALRHPAWGRAQETYGEDPHHLGEMGAALTRGVQRHVMATVKHFACNSMENARFQVDVRVDEAALHEVYLPHFKRIVDEGVACVMSAYNAVNGEWCGESPTLLTEILRDRWHFDGFVISDWIFGLRDAAASVNAGLDVEMPARMVRYENLAAAMERGEVDAGAVERAAGHTVAAMLRHATDPTRDRSPVSEDVLASTEHRALAREAATKAIVLLRNEPVDGHLLLPLDATSLARVAVIGHLADARNLGDGGSSDVYAPSVVTHLAGLRAALPHAEVGFADGADLEAAKELAAAADVAIVVVGYTRADEGEYIGQAGTSHLAALMPEADELDVVEAFHARLADDHVPRPDTIPGGDALGFSTGGDRERLTLHDADEALIAAVASATPRSVVALVAGSAVLTEGWRQTVPAMLQVWYSGMEGGHGFADVLLGRVDATGRLPFSVPTDSAHLPDFDRDAEAAVYDRWHGYWRLARDRRAPAFPFGFGLSYTSWVLGATTADADATTVTVTARLSNTGERPGADVLQVYAGRKADPDRPARRLVGFRRVELDAGQSADVVVEVPWDRLRVWEDGGWALPAGTYTFEVGRHSADVLSVDLVVERA
ncbi:MAG: beta-glucosidase family protein [Acidimicrobiales bacterium]